MKKFLKMSVLAAVAMVTMTGCISPSSVDAGEEAVLIYKPWVFGHGGVDEDSVSTGLTWTLWSTSVKRVDIKPFNIDEKFDDLITSDNNPVDFSIHMTFKHQEHKTPILVKNFGSDWYANNVKEPLRAATRAYTKSHKMFEMTTNKAVTKDLQDIVRQQVGDLLKQKGIPTELILITVGRVVPPQAVVTATINTAVQKQNVKTQNERVKAEQARTAAEQASAEADSAYMKKMDMTPQEYLQMKELENQRVAIDAAKDGNVKLNLIMGNAQPMFNIK